MSVSWRSFPREPGSPHRRGPAGASSVTNAWIEHGVEHVDQQVDQDVSQRKEQDQALDQRVIARQHGFYDESSQARQIKDRLGDYDTADQRGDADRSEEHTS